jgi:hypothetical protein
LGRQHWDDAGSRGVAAWASGLLEPLRLERGDAPG